MAQTGYTPIQLYRSATASAAPTAGNLADGELAINTADGKLFYKDSGGVVQVLATKAGAAGDVVGPASATDGGLVAFDGTTGKLVKAAATVTIAQGGTGQTTAQAAINSLAGAVTSGQYLRGNGTNVVMSAIQAADVPTLNQNTTGTASNVTGTVAIGNGGTGATTAANARTNLGGTTVGQSYFTLTNPSAITFPRMNADNTVSALSAADFRTAIGAGTGGGSVSSVDVSGGTTGLTTSGGPITSSGTITLAGTLGTTNGGTGLTSFTANGVVYASSTSALTTGSALTFDGTNLGIGTTSPTQPLSIRNASSAYLDLAGGNRTLGTNSFTFGQASDGVVAFFQRENAAMYWAVNASEQMRLTSTGLGIGTSSPAERLNIGSGGSIRLNRTDNAATGYVNLTYAGPGVGLVFDDRNSEGFSFRFNGSDRLRLDSSGNLGLGVTPSVSYGKEFSISADTASGVLGLGAKPLAAGNNVVYFSNNVKNTGAFTGAYWTSSPASKYEQNQGVHSWFTAPSGTAGNAITFTQAMTLDASGNLTVGATGGEGVVRGHSSADGTIATFRRLGGTYNTGLFIGNVESTQEVSLNASGSGGAPFFTFKTSNTERARIDASGNFGIGTNSPAAKLDVNGDYKEAVVTANTGTAYTINIANGTLQILTLTGNCTFTFPTATAGKSFMLFLKQDATGSRTVTWPSAVKWPGGTAPTITATASKLDKFVFTADGTNWIGSNAGQNYL